MQDIYYKMLVMLAIIFLGYFCRRIGVFQRSDARVISRIILNVTLPCVVIRNMNGVRLDLDILTAAIIGILCNAFFAAQAYLFSKASDPDDRVVKIYAFSSFNISSFVIPLLGDVVSPHALAGILAYNYPGTSLATYGYQPVAASMAYGIRDEAGVWKRTKDALIHNVSLITCVIMMMLSLLHLQLPEGLVGIADTLSSANTPLAMLSVGILMELNFPREEILYYTKLIAVRLGCAVICAAAIYWLAPISAELRRAMMLTVFAPIASTNPVLALHSGYNGGRVAVINSMYLIISVISMSVLAVILP